MSLLVTSLRTATLAVLLLAPATFASAKAPSAKAQAASCCATHTRCCPKSSVKYCCDEPAKASCCKTQTACCGAANCCGSQQLKAKTKANKGKAAG